MRDRSTPAGAALGAVLLIVSVGAALWVSGRFEIFQQDRGLLQLLVAIPLASLAVGGSAAFLRLLTVPQMLWAAAPVEALILVGSAVLGPGYRAWPWALVISAVVVVPWMAGILVGAAWGREDGVGA